jgi:hypothetical protein
MAWAKWGQRAQPEGGNGLVVLCGVETVQPAQFGQQAVGVVRRSSWCNRDPGGVFPAQALY